MTDTLLQDASDTSLALDFIAADALAHHLPAHVIAALAGHPVKVFSVSDDASDTAACSARYGFDMEDGANTLVLKYKREGAEHFAAVVTLASRRLDVNGAVKLALGAQRISFAQREVATAHAAMEFGGITAFGLPRTWQILVDENVMTRQSIVMGAGVRTAKLLLPPAVLAAIPEVRIAALTFAE